MKNNRFGRFMHIFGQSIKAVLLVLAATVPLFLIGRATLGEAVIALVYLVPVAWSASRWGKLAGMSGALAAALAFDFLFIPPFYTFAVERLEGWLVLVIFLAVAVLVVDRIQASLTKARKSVYMYELSSALNHAYTPEAVAHTVARNLCQLFQATLVNVIYHPADRTISVVASEPVNSQGIGKPDRILAILNGWGLVGEIQIWRGATILLPAEDDLLMQNFAMQTAQAFERALKNAPEINLKNLTSDAKAR